MSTRMLSCSICLALAACSGPAELRLPDGSARIQINSQQAIADYTAASARDAAASRATNQAASATGEIRVELEKLQQILREQEIGQAQQTVKAPRPNLSIQAAALLSGKDPHPSSVKGTLPSESISTTTTSTHFRVTFGEDETTFSPSAPFRKTLLSAAANGIAVSILGATDSAATTVKSERQAKERAENARAYLLAGGIDRGKVKIASLAAGAFIADNSTAAGRSLNRRVDIQIVGPSTGVPRAQPHSSARSNNDEHN